MSYWRFGAMIATSTVVMFILMYLNTYALEHLFWSETRVYMAILMGATMAVIMLSFMLSMYSSRAANIAIYIGSVIVFAGALWLVRSQETVQDRSFMSAMIPHHSIAIMTSSRAELTDPRVEKLAREIVLAQNREISEMRYLIASIGETGEAEAIYEGPGPAVGTLEDVFASVAIATLDPAPLPLDEAPDGADTAGLECGFRRVEGEAPVLWVGNGRGLMKLNGVVIPLDRLDGEGQRVWGADGVTMTVSNVPQADWRGGAELVFALERGLTVGYRGFFDCDA